MDEHIEQMTFSDFAGTRLRITEFLETQPLYVKLRIRLPPMFHQVIPEAVVLICSTCKAERPFRGARHAGGSGAGFPPPPTRVSGFSRLSYMCTGCENETLQCWIQVNYVNEDWIQKVGQVPIWLPAISKEIKEELGEDSELYQKALRNMNEGYGIGACAYLRRLLEKHINPLLQLLYDVKEEQGARTEELEAIQGAIKSKDFTSKTKFAADIAPPSILVKGHNPFKEIHERLSIGLHTLDDETANQYAQDIKDALEFIIRNLRRTHDERKAYAARLKKIRDLSIK